MLFMYSMESGSVAKDCSCLRRSTATRLNLPPSCYSKKPYSVLLCRNGLESVFKLLNVQNFKQGEQCVTDSLPDADLQSLFADGVGSIIANTLKWNTAVMDWLAYSGNMIDATNNLDVFLVLANTKALT